MTASRFWTFKRAALALAALIALGASASAAEPAEPQPTAKKQFDNPVRKLSAMMKKAGKLLDTLETGAPTQDEQKKILAELDRLIKMAQESSSSSSSQQQQKQNQQSQPKNAQPKPGNTKTGRAKGASPAPNETDILGSVRTRLGAGAPDLRAIWGKLPDAPRDDVMQLLREKLPMKYKQLLYLYFKALSEKK